MRVFKLYFQIVRSQLSVIFIYVGIFSLIAFIFGSNIKSMPDEAYTPKKLDVAVYNEDRGGAVAEGLHRYIGTRFNLVDIPDDKKSLDDALFYERINFALRIPKGFSERFEKPSELPISIEKTQGMQENMLVDIEVTKYLDTWQIYNNARNVSADLFAQEDVEEMIGEDLAKETTLKVFGSQKEILNGIGAKTYTSYMIYLLMSTVLSIICMTMLILNDKDTRAREMVAGFTDGRRYLELLLANVVFGIIIWGILIAVGMISFGASAFLGEKGLMLLGSSFIHLLAMISMALLISTIFQQTSAIEFIRVIWPLFIAFSSGIFIPMEFVWKPLQTAASFFPAYWQVVADEAILKLPKGSPKLIEILTKSFSIELVMMVAFFLLSLAIRRYRLKGENS